VGVFASRARGKVFLTEEDLERFDKAEACVALVISGDVGGFFVRDADGSIETVRSYKEILIHEPVEMTPTIMEKRTRWPWAACLIVLPLFFYRPHRPPLELTVHEAAGQLRISWNVPTTETLTILDGGERTYVPIGPGQTSATYARRTGDVTIGIGTTLTRFVGPPLPPTEIERMRAGIDELHAKIVALRTAKTAGQTKLAVLESRLQ
jgi:hypothetical protein